MLSTHLRVSVLLLLTAPAAAARAQRDYDPASDDWNGLSGLVDMARDEGVVLQVPRHLNIGGLDPADSVIIVYPTEDLPVTGLERFMREGGRVTLADDYGVGDELLSVYRIRRRVADVAGAPHLRGNRNLPVARPNVSHVLDEGVAALVTNHPTSLWHEDLEGIFTYDDAGGAVVLAGAVGEGRLLAIGDPSILINNMLQFRDNRRFASNLIRYMSARPGGQVYLVAGGADLSGHFGDPEAEAPFHRLSAWLQSVASADTPPLALLIGAILVAAILLLVAVTAVPRRSPYDGSAMFARPALAGGFVGRVWFFMRHQKDLLHPLLVYKYELEGELIRLLALKGRTLLRDVLRGLARAGLTPEEVHEARSLLLALDTLRNRQDHPSGPPRVDPRRFRAMVATGERILEKLESTS